MVCKIDLLASLSSLIGANETSIDSKNILHTLIGNSKIGRDHLIIEANSHTALRSGDWVMIPPYKGKAINNKVNIETGISLEYKLYNLKEDIGQKHNLAHEKPQKLKELIEVYKNLKL